MNAFIRSCSSSNSNLKLKIVKKYKWHSRISETVDKEGFGLAYSCGTLVYVSVMDLESMLLDLCTLTDLAIRHHLWL